jgi:hypothetical protein
MSFPLFVDGAVPVILELGIAGSATLELHHSGPKPTGSRLARCRVTTCQVHGGYHEDDFDLWDSEATSSPKSASSPSAARQGYAESSSSIRLALVHLKSLPCSIC